MGLLQRVGRLEQLQASRVIRQSSCSCGGAKTEVLYAHQHADVRAVARRRCEQCGGTAQRVIVEYTTAEIKAEPAAE